SPREWRHHWGRPRYHEGPLRPIAPVTGPFRPRQRSKKPLRPPKLGGGQLAQKLLSSSFSLLLGTSLICFGAARSDRMVKIGWLTGTIANIRNVEICFEIFIAIPLLKQGTSAVLLIK